jgi:hypothetical protein
VLNTVRDSQSVNGARREGGGGGSGLVKPYLYGFYERTAGSEQLQDIPSKN